MMVHPNIKESVKLLKQCKQITSFNKATAGAPLGQYLSTIQVVSGLYYHLLYPPSPSKTVFVHQAGSQWSVLPHIIYPRPLLRQYLSTRKVVSGL